MLLSAPGDPRGAWTPLARVLAAHHWGVLVAGLRSDTARSVAAPAEAAELSDPSLLWRNAQGAMAWARRFLGDSLQPLVLGGSGLSAAAAVICASRSQDRPVGLLLVSPEPELAETAITPLLSHLELPSLCLEGRNDLASDRVREIYLASRPSCTLWETDGAGRGCALFSRDRSLLEALAEWCDRLPASRRPALKNR